MAKDLGGGRSPADPWALMGTYMASVLCKGVLEAGFLYGQWRLYGWTMEPVFVCQRSPAPTSWTAVSNPARRAIFITLHAGGRTHLPGAQPAGAGVPAVPAALSRGEGPAAPGCASAPGHLTSEPFTHMTRCGLLPPHEAKGPSSHDLAHPAPRLSSSERSWANLGSTEERLASSRPHPASGPTPRLARNPQSPQ